MELFIKNVMKYPCIWDTNSIAYRDLRRKDTAWENVSRECRLSNAKEAKDQWKRLRDSHREALRRRKTTSGQAANKYKPWKYEKLMKFLQPQLYTKTLSYYTNPDETGPNTQVTSPEDVAKHEPVPAEDPIDVEESTNKGLVDSLDKRERRRGRRLQNELNVLRRELFDRNRLIHKEDALMSLFISMCEKTKALPKYLQLRVQREVFESVTKAEEEVLSIDSHKFQYRTYAHSSFTNQLSDETDLSSQSPVRQQHTSFICSPNPEETMI